MTAPDAGLDRAMHQRGSVDVVAHQRLVERVLADGLGGFAAQGVVAVFLQRLAQRVQNLAERTLAGAVAEKAVVVLQLDIEAVYIHRRQTGRAMPGDARGRDDIFSHFALPSRNSRGTTAREPVGFIGGMRERLSLNSQPAKR